MSLTALFIRRPVMTTLVMIGDPRLRHRRVPQAAGERSADRRLSDDQRQREPAGREPGDDGRHGRDAAGESSSRRSPASTT